MALLLSLTLLLNAAWQKYSTAEYAAPIALSAFPVAASSSVVDYYVRPDGKDSGDGSVAHPWRTIQHAAGAVQPGATVHVAPGNYYGAVETKIDGKAPARIRFVSDVRWAANLNAFGAYTAWKNTADYVDIEGFEIAGSKCLGINNEGSYARMLYNHVHDIPATQCGNDGGAGIDNSAYRAKDNDIIGNVVHDIGSPENPNQLVHGIYHSNLRGHIANNVVFRAAAWGISLWHAARMVTISNNTVFNNGAGGIMVGAGDAPGGIVNDHTVVSNNIVVRNRGYGISENTATGRANRYVNNLLFQNERAYYLQNGIRPSGSIEKDPQFVDYTGDWRGDYRLKKTSPAINAAAPLGAPLGDIEGQTRKPGARLDLGAYEWMPATAGAQLSSSERPGR